MTCHCDSPGTCILEHLQVMLHAWLLHHLLLGLFT